MISRPRFILYFIDSSTPPPPFCGETPPNQHPPCQPRSFCRELAFVLVLGRGAISFVRYILLMFYMSPHASANINVYTVLHIPKCKCMPCFIRVSVQATSSVSGAWLFDSFYTAARWGAIVSTTKY